MPPENSNSFTAAQIAAALGKTPRAIRKRLEGITPADQRDVAGNSTKVYSLDKLPAGLIEALAVEARDQKCSIGVLLALPRRQWQPPIPMNRIHPDCIADAEKLREALRPFLTAPINSGLTAEEWKQRGADYYFRVFKKRITPEHWDRLLQRTQQRDNGLEKWDFIQIYLKDRLKRASAPAAATSFPNDDSAEFEPLKDYLRCLQIPGRPNRDEIIGIWQLALAAVEEMISAGELEKRAERRVREFLWSQTPFLAPTKDALWIAFKRKIAVLKNSGRQPEAIADGRADNGDTVEIPAEDIDRLRHSAAFKNGMRVNAAWREEYPSLSATTRSRYPYSIEAPPKVHECLNRKIVDLLGARHQGKRTLRRMLPTVRRDWHNMPSMHTWVVDDMTSPVEIGFKAADGSPLLQCPQIIAAMDSASRKFVGFTVALVKAPNARIVCDAVRSGFKIHGVPKAIGLENGFVFGKSHLVNGQQDDFGNTLVVGLGHFGCRVRHFEKMNPTSKSELEYGFHQIQCLMERLPGYGGRSQLTDAPEDFKLEQRLICAGKADPMEFRLTLDELIDELAKIILQYNATPQGGRLKGLSPDEAFAAGIDQSDPPIQFTPKLEWLLSDRQLVQVKAGGVNFTYLATREKIQVFGRPLVNMVGQELWALMDPRDTSIVTFMTTDYSKTFTMEIAPAVNPSQRDLAPGSDALAKVRAGIREHERAVSDEYNRLKSQYGNPRRDLLQQIRGSLADQNTASGPDSATRRITIAPRKMVEAGEEMQQQRAELSDAKQQRSRRTAANKSRARQLGIPTVLVGDDEQTRRALELRREARRAGELKNTEGTEP